jgi:hypothetical protein
MENDSGTLVLDLQFGCPVRGRKSDAKTLSREETQRESTHGIPSAASGRNQNGVTTEGTEYTEMK